MSRAQEHRSFNEVVGLILLGVGTLLFLALISYDPRQVPDRFPLSTTASAASNVAANFVGPLGAIVACCFYFLLGAASYLVAVTMLGYGGAKLLRPELQMRRHVWAIVAFIVSGACILQLQSWFLQDWPMLMNTRGANQWRAGGWFGYWIGHGLFETPMGTIGALLLLLCVYSVSLIFMTDIHPILLARRLAQLPGKWQQALERRRLAMADDRGRLEIAERRLARETERLERK